MATDMLIVRQNITRLIATVNKNIYIYITIKLLHSSSHQLKFTLHRLTESGNRY